MASLTAPTFADMGNPPPGGGQAPDRSAVAGVADPVFNIEEFRVLGNSVLTPRDIETAVYPYLGLKKTIHDVESARKALEDVYHNKGFATVFVDIPEQQVDEGIVRLHVADGKLRSIRVNGARYFSARQIRSALPSAAEDSVPNLPSLQNELTKLNTQTPDRTVVPVLKAGPVPGTVDLSLKVDDRLPLHGSVEINNQYTPSTKPLRAMASISYDDMFGRLDSLSLQYQVAPQDTKQAGVLAASYTAHINDEGARLAFSYIDSSSNIATLGALAIVGKGKIIGTHWIQPLVYTAGSSQTLTAGVDYKDFAQNIQVDPNSVVKTPITYLNYSLAYAGAWRGSVVQWGVDSTLNFGIRGLVNSQREFGDKRFNASADYMYLRSNASVGVRLPADFTAILKVSGQYSAEPLISNEQFTIGGADSVRGYLEAEELGDIGIRSAVQLGSPQLKLWRNQLRLDGFLFSDFARVNTIDALRGEPSNQELRSAGVGMNLYFFDHVTGALTWAYPLATANETRSHDSRLLFNLRGAW
jgi:hemolysin activation/secretion protein